MAAIDEPIPRDDRTTGYTGRIWTPIEIEAELDRLRGVVDAIVTHLALVDEEAVAAKRNYDVVRARALVAVDTGSEKVKIAKVDGDEKVIAARIPHDTAEHVVRITRERLKEAYEAIDIVRSISASIRVSYESAARSGSRAGT